MGWPMVKLGEVLDQDLDFVTDLEPGTYKKLSVKLYGKGVVPDKPVEVHAVRMKKHQIAKEGQIIVSEIWAKKRAIGIVPPNGNGALCTSHFYLFNRKPERVMEGWLRYLLIANFLEPQLSAEARGTTGYASVRPRHFLYCEVPLPPLAEQQRIVAKLDKVAALVEERRKVIEAAEYDAQVMLSNAFRKIIDGAPYRTMAEVAPLVRRPVEIEPDQPYTEIGIKSFYNGIFHRRTMDGAEYSWQKLFWIKEGDLIFSNLMAWEKAIAVASAEDAGCVGNHRMLTCEVNRTLATPTFLLAYFRTEEGFMQVMGHSPGSIARNKTLSSKKLPTIKVPVPPIERQRWFDRLQTQVHQVGALRESADQDVDALLPAMLHGVFDLPRDFRTAAKLRGGLPGGSHEEESLVHGSPDGQGSERGGFVTGLGSRQETWGQRADNLQLA